MARLAGLRTRHCRVPVVAKAIEFTDHDGFRFRYEDAVPFQIAAWLAHKKTLYVQPTCWFPLPASIAE